MQSKEMSDITNNKLFWDLKLLKTAVLIKLSNIARTKKVANIIVKNVTVQDDVQEWHWHFSTSKTAKTKRGMC